MVAYGNPPYNVSSQNRNSWIEGLIAPYKAGLNEKNINPLSDDYIKFIRNAEYYIEKNGGGVMAMITNNSYLDGIIHRQMRLHLLQTFDEIYIYDLHGSAKKKERSPDGTPDKNVFDIQQGVSIIIAVKHNNVIPTKVGIHKNQKMDSRLRGSDGDGAAVIPAKAGIHEKPLATLYHYSSYGARNAKYDALYQDSLKNTPWQKLQPHEPYYFFVPKDFTGNVEYETGFALNELFVVNGSGVKFRKDNILVKNNYTIEKLIQSLDDIQKLSVYQLFKKYEFTETKDWILEEKRQYFKNYKHEDFMMVDYKPFDYRYAYYPLEKINKIIPRGDSRHNLMKHIIGGNNYCLLTSRSFPANQNFDRAFISKSLVDIHAASDQTYCFPLYLYEKDNHGTDDDLFAENAPQNSTVIPAQAGIQKKAKMDSSLRWSDGDEIKNFTRKPNFHPEIIKQIAEKLGLAFVADDSCHTREGGYPWTPAFAGVTEMESGVTEMEAGVTEMESGVMEMETGVTKTHFNPLNLLDYIYAVLHSPHYRNTYKEFLKIDFPRIPYPDDAPKFWQLVKLGGKLRALHLMEHEALDKIKVGYHESGDNIIEKVEYIDGKVFINKEQHFNNVSEIAWNFTIGGYQPAQKWLKDRKGEKLTIADVSHYGRIIIALAKTHELMQKIDEVTS
jgi:hypothetical protein